jgi:hypothetical protein
MSVDSQRIGMLTENHQHEALSMMLNEQFLPLTSHCFRDRITEFITQIMRCPNNKHLMFLKYSIKSTMFMPDMSLKIGPRPRKMSTSSAKGKFHLFDALCTLHQLYTPKCDHVQNVI